LLAAAEADRIEREEARADLKASSDADKAHSEIKKNKSIEVLNYEKAETEDVKNQISTHKAVGELDNQELQNQQALQQIQQPQGLNDDK